MQTCTTLAEYLLNFGYFFKVMFSLSSGLNTLKKMVYLIQQSSFNPLSLSSGSNTRMKIMVDLAQLTVSIPFLFRAGQIQDNTVEV